MKTPMSSSIKLNKDEKGKSVNSTMYRGMIGSFLYLTPSRPDIMYSVCLCARFQSCPKESHLSVIKQILRYLKGTMDIGLWYPKRDNFELIGFSDADFAGCKIERKSTRERRAPPRLEPSALLSHLSLSRRRLAERRDYRRYKQKFAHRKVIPGKSINFSQFQHFGFKGLFSRMGWLPIVTIFEPIFPTLVRAFYSRVTYGLEGPVLSTVRGVEIKLSPESICRILDIPSVGLRVYESKFEKASDDSWIRRVERSPVQAWGQGQMHPGVEEEAEIRDMEDELDPQRDFEQREPELDIPPPPQSEGIHVEATFSEPMMIEPSYTAGPSS
uniref:Retrovirus-related Pol polyprotein from transposon RE1 n=1 Tax=Vitis vinifera TaxID=29760 RepID=A5CBV6_VITVI|nr:hypothetical protein VITISV_027399 [Vitis vinifera]